MTGPLTVKQKAAKVVRQHILEAAIQVFAERGFHRATIRDVARAAGVSDGAIYNVFENKAALLLGMLDPLGEAELGQAPPPPAGNDLDGFVRDLVRRRWATFTPATLPMLRVVLSEVLVDRDLRARFVAQVIAPALTRPEPQFAAMAAEGRLRSDDVAMTLRIMTATFLGLVVLRLLGEPTLERQADEVADALSSLLLDGLRPAAAEAR